MRKRLLNDLLKRQQLSSDGLRKFNDSELGSSKEIVLSALVDDADQSVLGGTRIRQHPIDFSSDQRCLVPGVIETKRERCSWES